ncbi:ISAs1 family transposase [Shewanella waksmanii]|uniref:ISAs1 family transposase n=1 Tax=Shewanella waksmanii TaxID=213783 RepID=UPI0037366DF5
MPSLGQTLHHPYGLCFCHTIGVVIGQLKTEEKSNEITAIPDLLSLLDIEGCLISIDAMGCQKAIARIIIDKKADYFLAVKVSRKPYTRPSRPRLLTRFARQSWELQLQKRDMGVSK